MRHRYFTRIIICLILIILASVLTRVEICGFKMKTIAYPLIWLTTGVFLYLISGYLSGSGSAIRKSFLGLGLAVYILSAPLFILQVLICGESQTDTKYANLENDTIFLECRSYDCFLTSGPCQLTQVRTLLTGINWITTIDESYIDPTRWKVVPKAIN